MAKSQLRASSAPPDQRIQLQRAQWVTALILLIATLVLIVELVLGFGSGDWHGVLALATTLLVMAVSVVALIQLRAGHLQRGGWILIVMMLMVGPLGVLSLAGASFTVGLIQVVVIILIAEIALPSAKRSLASAIGFGGLLITLLIDLADVPGRINNPTLLIILPVIVVVFLSVLGYLIVRQFSGYSLRGKLIVVSLAVSLIPLLLLGLVFTTATQQRELDNVNQSLTAAAQETAARLDEFTQNGLDIVRAAAQTPDFITLLKTPENAPEHGEALTRASVILRSLSSTDPQYLSSFAVLDQLGNTVADTYGIDIGTNKSDRAYFTEAIARGLPYVSNVSLDPSSGRPSIYFSSPVRAINGETLGVVRIRYNADVFQDQLHHYNDLAGSNSGAILLDDKNIQIANGRDPGNAFKIVGSPSPEDLISLKAQQRLPPDRPAAELILNLPDFARSLADNSPVFSAEIEGPASSARNESSEQAAIAPLKTLPWKVVFSRPQQEFLGPITQQVRLITLGGLVVVLLIVGIAILASQAIARPVIALTNTAQKISQGDLSARAEVSTQDEIGALALMLNAMTGQIRDLVTSLEDRVQARTAQLEASAEVGRAATSILDTDQLLNDTASLISRRFGFYYVAIFTVDATESNAILRAATGEAGRVLLERGHRLPIKAESMVGSAILSRQSRIALDVGQEAIRFANPLLPYTRSEIALPLRVGDRALGALDVQSEQSGAFDEASAAVLQSMADQIAVALLNAETFRRSERQSHILAILNQLSHNLTSAQNLEQMAYATISTVKDLLGLNHVSLAQTTVNANLLAVQEIKQDPSAPLSEALSLPLSHSLIEQALQHNEPLYTRDLQEVAHLCSDIPAMVASGAHSSVVVPLRVGERALGALIVTHEDPGAYNQEQVNQLAQIGAQLSVALDNLHLVEQTRATFEELDKANRRLMGQVWSNYLKARGDVVAEWRNGQWSLVKERQTTTALQTQSDQSIVRLPIQVRGGTIGEIDVTVAEAQLAQDRDKVTFAQALVDQVGQILENARLLEETERLAQREKAIAGAADKIHRSTEIDGVLHTAVAELNRIIGRRGISIQLGFSGTDNRQKQPSQNMTLVRNSSVSAAGDSQSAEAEGGRSHA